ncbi:MAG: NADH-quinone oxidoreductase subunit NuoN [Lautropia sp.]|nr:NADH-quinone oxidoreductase subunit NuoN [Lautropia sp.]
MAVTPLSPHTFNLAALAPEILLTLGIAFFLLTEALFGKKSAIRADLMALAMLVPPFVAVLWQTGQGHQFAFGEMYVADGLSHLLKICAIIATGSIIVYARRYVRERPMRQTDLYALALFSLLGQMVLISGANLLVLYLGLELMSLALYAVIALRREWQQGTEAAMKYFVLGALASGFLLYGMSMLYGATGSLSIFEIMVRVHEGMASPMIMTFGLVFIVAGLAFKLGAVPFHMWVPDVYHGAPTVTTLMVAAGPKLAAFALMFRLLGVSLVDVSQHWQMMLIILAVLSLGVGNILAVAQTNLKRMLAYSTISQVGFVLLGVAGFYGSVAPGLAAVDQYEAQRYAFGSSLFYMITYVLTTLGTFGMIQLLAREGFEAEEIGDLAGLVRRSPWLAGVMVLLMFSLAGIPPLVGFYAKLAVLKSIIGAGYTWVAVYAVLMSLVGAFYYIRVIKVMVFDTPKDESAIEVDAGARGLMAANGLAVLLLGIFPGALMALCINAIGSAWALG